MSIWGFRGHTELPSGVLQYTDLIYQISIKITNNAQTRCIIKHKCSHKSQIPMGHHRHADSMTTVTKSKIDVLIQKWNVRANGQGLCVRKSGDVQHRYVSSWSTC
jgi:hypothetical protein